MSKRILFIDFETRSEAELKDVGAHKYNIDVSTRMLLCAYAFDNNPTQVCEEIPDDVWNALENDEILKVAHNAEFDMCVCKYVLGIAVSLNGWLDTAYQASYYGLPRSLKNLANVLGTQKKASQDGVELFSKPIKPKLKRASSDANKEYNRLIQLLPAKFNTQEDYPLAWDNFVEYARGDVDVMRECFHRMVMLPQLEIDAMHETFDMNFNGVPFDIGLANRIMDLVHEYETTASKEALERYGIVNLRSTAQVHDALRKEGIVLPTLNVKERGDVSHPILDLRECATGSAFKKLPKAVVRICPDGKLRGEFVGFGAHTGRWSSRGVQLQNWYRILSDVSETMENVRDYEHLKQHLRLCLGHDSRLKFTCADLSQIEARIVAYLADCKWLCEAFANGDDVYSRTASKMFGGDCDTQTGRHPKREYGKAAVLGFGYGGSGLAIERINKPFYDEIGAEAAQALCYTYRDNHPEIKRLWYQLMGAWREAMTKVNCTVYCANNRVRLRFIYDGKTMRIMLPSGRSLYYRDVKTTHNEYGEGYAYANYGEGHTKYEYIWHGVVIENIVQALARDILVGIMTRTRKRKLDACIIGAVHDEVWYTHPEHVPMLDIILEEMAYPIEWASGLITKGDGFTSDRYRK